MRHTILIACSLSLASCASVTRGWDEQIHFSSVPSEANVRTSTGFQCLTPCALQARRKEEFTAVFSKPGYHSLEVPVRPQLSGGGAAGFMGNVVLGGVVGMGVDIASGAALEHCPNPVSVTLQKIGSKDDYRPNPIAHCAPPVDQAMLAATAEERSAPR